jgi:hypothetical protein
MVDVCKELRIFVNKGLFVSISECDFKLEEGRIPTF